MYKLYVLDERQAICGFKIRCIVEVNEAGGEHVLSSSPHAFAPVFGVALQPESHRVNSLGTAD